MTYGSRTRGSGPVVFGLMALVALGCGSPQTEVDGGTPSGADGGVDGGGVVPIASDGLCFGGWCWENPRPHGLTVNAVWTAGPTDTWIAGGQMGLLRWDGAQFVQYDLPPGVAWVNITSLWGSSPSEVWALSPQGLFHFDGTSWSVDDRLAAYQGLGALWGTGPTNLWAAGGRRILHFDGTAWTEQLNDFSLGLVAISGSSDTDVWAVSGGAGKVAHWDGTTWSVSTVGDGTHSFTDVWVGAANDVWAVGDYRAAWHFDGSAWTSMSPQVGTGLNHLVSVWGAPGQPPLGLTTNGRVAHFDGATWQAIYQSDTYVWKASQLRGSAPDNVWAVGSDGLVVHFDGAGWSRPGRPEGFVGSAFYDLAGVSTPAGPRAWAVGPARTGGDIITSRGPSGLWTKETTGLPRLNNMEVIAASAADNVWTADESALYRFDGANWNIVPMPAGRSGIADLCTFGPTQTWVLATDALAEDPQILRWDGAAWHKEAEVSASLWFSDEMVRARLFCLSPEEMWLGAPELLMRRVGTGWQRQGMGYWNRPRGTSGPGLHTYVASAQERWALRRSDLSYDNGAVARFDGKDWRQMQLPAEITSSATHLHGSSPDNVWLTAGRKLVRWDGSALTPVDVGATGWDLRAVWAFSPTEVLAFNQRLSAYRWDGTSATVTHSPDAATLPPLGDPRPWFLSPTFGFIVEGITVMRWNGIELVKETIPANFYPNSVWGFAADDVWLVGNSLKAAHWDGTEWTVVTLPEGASGSEAVIDIWGAAANDVWALGEKGSIFHHTGSGFVRVSPEVGFPATTNVRGSAANDVHFLGGGAARWNGVAFEAASSLENPIRIQRIDGALVAADGWGGLWTRQPTGWAQTGTTLRDPLGVNPSTLFGTAAFVSPSEAYLLHTTHGVLWRSDSVAVAQVPELHTVNSLTAIEPVGDDLFVIGWSGGIVLRRQR